MSERLTQEVLAPLLTMTEDSLLRARGVAAQRAEFSSVWTDMPALLRELDAQRVALAKARGARDD